MSTIWFISMKWIYELFLDETWNKAEDRTDLLHPPKTYGERHFADTDWYYDRTWRASQSSEALSADSRSRVFRNQKLASRLPASDGMQESDHWSDIFGSEFKGVDEGSGFPLLSGVP